MIHRVRHFIQRQLLRSSCYRWRVFTPRISRETIEPLLARYRVYAAGGPYRQQHPDGSTTALGATQLRCNSALQHKRVVYLCDGSTLAGGLADRFKGILSLFAVCQEMGYDFRICYTSPFTLQHFLLPAAYDWVITPAELNHDDAAMLVLENTEDSDYQTRRQAQWLRDRLHEGPAEMHVITNSNYAYQLDYAALFNRLFRPAPHLQQALDAEVRAMGPFVSVNARFLSMLGDFEETGANSSLPEAEAEALILRNIEQLALLHAKHPATTILVNSDSMRFLRRAAELPFVHVVEGQVAHTDLMASHGADAMHLKLFLDFLLIARASHVYLLRTGLMRISGFPYAASRISGAPFSIIQF